MAVASTNPVASELANGVKTAFDFTFKIFEATDLVVEVETAAGSNVYLTQTYSAAYTVVFDKDAETGTVTFLVAPTTGKKVVITRYTPQTQGSTLPIEGKMPSKVVEDALDRLTLLIQEARALLSLPFTPSPAPTVLVDYVLKYEGLYAAKPVTPVVWMMWWSTDLQQLEIWVPAANKWFLIG